MIASLRGTAVSIDSSQVVLEVSGVGYAVQVSGRVANSLQLNDDVFMHTAMIVREDSMTLYGFLLPAELQAFNMLCSVTGVGPKSALSILSELTVDEVANAVTTENDSVFKSVSGVGPKTAKLICVTLAGKFGKSTSNSPTGRTNDEILAALVSLGWNERNAREAVSIALKQSPSATNNELLKISLAFLGNSKSVGVSNE